MLETQGMIEAVTEPTEWCAPIVVAIGGHQSVNR